MNHSETLLIPLLLFACLAAGFTIHMVRQTGWRRTAGWLAAITAAALGGSMLITQLSVPWSDLLPVVATILPLCVMMIPLLGMLVLGWLTGAQLASGFLLLTKRFIK